MQRTSRLPRALALALALAFTFTLAAAPGEALAKKKKGALRFGKQGTVTVAGTAHFSSESNTDIKKGEAADESADGPTTLGLGARAGYFLWGNKALSVEGAAELSFERSDSSDFKSSTFGVFAVPTLYLNALRKKGLFPFAQLGVGYVNVGTETEVLSKTVESSAGGLGLKPGLGIALALGKAQGAFLRLQLNYEIQTLTDKDDNGARTGTLAARVGVGAFF